jgi:hypothetical protein
MAEMAWRGFLRRAGRINSYRLSRDYLDVFDEFFILQSHQIGAQQPATTANLTLFTSPQAMFSCFALSHEGAPSIPHRDISQSLGKPMAFFDFD